MADLPGQVVAYNRAVEVLTQNEPGYATGQISVSLHTTAYSPNSSHAYDTELRGEVSGGNYEQQKLQGREVVFDLATQRFQFKATRVRWFMVTLTARWAVIRLDVSGANLIGWVDLGGVRQVVNSTFSIAWDADMILEVESIG
jgi:hypothetical protein